MHEQFFFDDNPMNRIIGFVCSCSGNDQKWEISLPELKTVPIEVNSLLLMLRERDKDPTGPWHLMQHLRAVKDSNERHKLFMRNQRISSVIVAIEHVLTNETLSKSRRKRLQRRRSRLRTKLSQ